MWHVLKVGNDPWPASLRGIQKLMFQKAIRSRMVGRIALTVALCTVGAELLMAWLARASALSLPVLLLCGCAVGLLCAAVAVAYMLYCYMPGIQALLRGLQQFDAGDGPQLPDVGRDDWRAMIGAFNRGIGAVQERVRSLETLAEIDRLLLPGTTDLEQALDVILARVQRLTACRTAGIVLRDLEAPGRGRVFMAANGDAGLPLARVALDARMMETLAVETAGLTVTRCEDVRHSFLRPLREQGAEFFWVWPVLLDDALRAILAIGFPEAPSASPQIIRSGDELVQRLDAVLARSARDDRLYRQAHYDPLTGLPNRVLFASTLLPEIDSAAAGITRGSVLYVDLDHFKKVNDTAGHAAGDQLLCIVAQRLRACVKDSDTVARLGGDEFAVILRDVDVTQATAVSGRIVESLQQAVRIDGRDHHVCASIGMAMFPQDGNSLNELLRNADIAMYRAKEQGRGRAVIYDRSMGGALAAPTETGLQLALRQREFSLFYQPQYATRDGGLTGLEGLLRWQTERAGMRVPGDFVPAAEESGLIVDIGGWVLEAACEQLAQWRGQGLSPPPLSLNVSVQQLRHPGFVRTVRQALARHELPGDLLELDIEESAFAEQECAPIIGRLATLGVRLALDGFSTGYASLSYLRQYPVASVKLDRAFLKNVPGDDAAAQLVETVIVIAHSLGKRVVAEGIETIEQLDFLRGKGCDSVQGFYLARPLQAAAMTELLVSHGGHTELTVRAAV